MKKKKDKSNKEVNLPQLYNLDPTEQVAKSQAKSSNSGCLKLLSDVVRPSICQSCWFDFHCYCYIFKGPKY